MYDGFVAKQMAAFSSQTNLPAFIHGPYLHTLAYLEIALGLMLLLGVRTKYALAATSLTYVSIAYGLMLRGSIDGVNGIGIHLLISAAALYFVRHNKCELLR